ncbi:MAG: AraC family transcriptional regulator [Clostridiales bacterium]|nr:AraC family transcriptional regulator [Clostridiales bacterium]
MSDYTKHGYLTSSFKIFHLKDQARQDFSYHYHDFHKILILLSGDVTYCVEGRSYDLLPGDIVLLNAGEVHRPIIKSDAPYERIIIYISTSFLADYQEGETDLSLCLRQAATEQSHVLRFHTAPSVRLTSAIHALDLASADTDYAAALYQKVLFLEFMIHLNRASLSNRLDFIESSPSDEKVAAILSYLNEHLTEDISIDRLSSRFFLSRYYLMHSFKEQTGYTVGNYLTTKRLILAKKLIAEGLPITEVCYSCGFKNYSTFSRAYKKSFGESPRDYRQSLL